MSDSVSLMTGEISSTLVVLESRECSASPGKAQTNTKTSSKIKVKLKRIGTHFAHTGKANEDADENDACHQLRFIIQLPAHPAFPFPVCAHLAPPRCGGRHPPRIAPKRSPNWKMVRSNGRTQTEPAHIVRCVQRPPARGTVKCRSG